jgi:hypothetical protein
MRFAPRAGISVEDLEAAVGGDLVGTVREALKAAERRNNEAAN